MIFKVNHCFPSLVLALALALAAVATSAAQDNSAPYSGRTTSGVKDRSAAASELADQVHEIATSMAISRTKKEKRISTAVRVAVVAGVAYKKDPEEIIGIALELTEAAAQAAPGFAEIIANAVAFTPGVTRINSAPSQVRSAAYSAAKNPRRGRSNHSARRKPADASAAAPAKADDDNNTPGDKTAVAETSDQSASMGAANDMGAPEPTHPNGKSKFDLESNHRFRVTAQGEARHDDNVFLTNQNKVGDTIFSLTPGVEFTFGQNALAHGGLTYKEAFTRYAHQSAPNVNLGLGSADFGYDNGNTAVVGSATFQQLYQNDASVAALGEKKIFRRDVLDLAASVESHLTAKTSVKVAANFDQSEYKTDGLIGSQEIAVPVKVYYEATPKLSVSTGAEYRVVKPQDGGPDGKDTYYNVGVRGNFTPKLTGEVSVGYRTRSVTKNPDEHLLGFDGSLNYEITAKTGASLALSRDFSTGALGESLKNSSYSFKVFTDPTTQWQFSTALTYRNVDYGPTVFSSATTLINTYRRDNYWEGSFTANYLLTNSISFAADYTIRSNSSTIPGVRFSDNLLSLSAEWSY